MIEELFRDRVRERDLDNFLVEELHSSRGFRDWLLQRLDAFDPPADCEVRLQKSPTRLQDARQTDVQIGWFDASGAIRARVLIESKVTADFQTGQVDAYVAETEAARGAHGQTRAASLLVAPASRLATLVGAALFDGRVSIEEIADALEARRDGHLPDEIDARLAVRVQLLEALCGRRQSSTWIRETVPEKRDFAEAYAALAHKRLPGLSVSPSTDGPKAITRLFTGLVLPGLPVPKLRHEYGRGVPVKWVNAQFSGLVDKVGKLRSSGLLDRTPYSAEQASGSLAIRVPTPGIDPERPFASQRDAVIEGLDATGALVGWLKANVVALASVIMDALEEPPIVAPVLNPRAIERELGAELRGIYAECDALGYRPTAMLEMAGRLDALETVRRLISQPLSQGFGRLAAMGRLDLAVEALVLKERWKNVFSDDDAADRPAPLGALSTKLAPCALVDPTRPCYLTSLTLPVGRLLRIGPCS